MNLKNKHYVFILPTLMDDALAIRLFTRFWPLFGLIPVIFKFGWKNIKNEDDLNRGFDRVVLEIDRLANLGTVSLLGCSAGGNILVNIFSQRKNVVHRVVNICGALRSGKTTNKLDTPAYLKALEHCEQAIEGLSQDDRQKIMTIRPRFGDEFIKKEQVYVEGAKNITIPTAEHMFSVMMSLTLFSKAIFNFLKSKS